MSGGKRFTNGASADWLARLWLELGSWGARRQDLGMSSNDVLHCKDLPANQTIYPPPLPPLPISVLVVTGTVVNIETCMLYKGLHTCTCTVCTYIASKARDSMYSIGTFVITLAKVACVWHSPDGHILYIPTFRRHQQLA